MPANYQRNNKIRSLRMEKGFTQLELAERSGLPLPTLARIDQSESVKVHLRQAKCLAKALGVGVLDLLP